MDKLFFDIEVFKHDTIVVFKSIDKKIYKIAHNDWSGIREIVDNFILVGFNNYYYDDVILSGILDGYTPEQIKTLNDDIIIRKITAKKPKLEIKSLDCFQQIDVSNPGLKKLEGNMGASIIESPVDFTLDRRLTQHELEQVIKYCAYDVDSTIDIWKMRSHYFETKQMLVDLYGNPRSVRWNTTTLSAKVLIDKPLPKWSSIRIEDRMLDMVDSHVAEMWLNASKSIGVRNYKGKAVINRFDNEITFGFGGLHGVHKSIKRAENVTLLDVTSMYPNIIIQLGALGPATAKYQAILDERVRIKSTDETRSKALKLILNSTYGLLKNQYSVLDNPKAALSVCIFGQIALYKLCEMISPYVTIININTDGVAFVPNSQRFQEVVPEWEEMFGLKLESDQYDLFIQKNVNSYIAVKDGKVVDTIGAETTRYHHDAIFKNNNARILDIALVNKLVYDKDIITTLMEHTDQPALFQYILKAGSTYVGTVDQNRNKQQNVNRIFASKREDTKLYKMRPDGGLVMFADTPDKMRIWNHDLTSVPGFTEDLDLNHYYQIIYKRLEGWM